MQPNLSGYFNHDHDHDFNQDHFYFIKVLLLCTYFRLIQSIFFNVLTKLKFFYIIQIVSVSFRTSNISTFLTKVLWIAVNQSVKHDLVKYTETFLAWERCFSHRRLNISLKLCICLTTGISVRFFHLRWYAGIY